MNEPDSTRSARGKGPALGLALILACSLVVWVASTVGGDRPVATPDLRADDVVGAARPRSGGPAADAPDSVADARRTPGTLEAGDGAASSASLPGRTSTFLRVLDPAGRPLSEAAAVLGGAERVLPADGEGVIHLGEDLVSLTSGWVGAPGHVARRFSAWGAGQVLVLETTEGATVEVVERETGAAVEGARVRLLRSAADPRGVLARALSGGDGVTDVAGRVDIPGPTPRDDRDLLSVELPSGPTVVVPGDWFAEQLAESAERVVRVLVGSDSATLELRFVEGPGRPVAGRDVRLLRGDLPLGGTTGADGVLGVPVDTVDGRMAPFHGKTVCEVDLGNGSGWRSEVYVRPGGPQVLVKIDHGPVEVRVEHSDPARFVVATACAMDNSRDMYERVRALRFGAQPQPDELLWMPLEPGGRATLANGWQGVETCVLLRDPVSEMVLTAELVDRGTVVTLRPPELARVAVRSAEPGPAPPGALVLYPTDESGNLPQIWTLPLPEVPLQDLPTVLDVPFGWWRPRLEFGRSRPWEQVLGVFESDVELVVDLPGGRLVEGVVRGEFRGPLADALVGIHSEADGSVAWIRTDGSGSFSIEVFEGGPLYGTTTWPGFASWLRRVEAASDIEFPIPPESGRLDVLLPEARLLIEELPGTLAGRLEVEVHAVQPGVERLALRIYVKRLGQGETWAFVLPPIEVSVSVGVGETSLFEQTVMLRAGAEERVVVDPGEATILELVLDGSGLPQDRGWEYDLSLLDGSGSALDQRRSGVEPDYHGSTPRELFLLDPGEYTLDGFAVLTEPQADGGESEREVELHAAITVEPDAWTTWTVRVE